MARDDGGGPAVRVALAGFMKIERLGLTRWINGLAGWSVCGEVDAVSALLVAEAPHVYLLGLDLCVGRGVGLVRQLHQGCGKPILVVAPHDGKLLASRCLAAGASGYLNSRASMAELEMGIKKVLRSEYAISPEVGNCLLSAMCGRRAALPKVTDRQLETFYMAAVMPAKNIAKRLQLSLKTVESHLKGMQLALRLKSRIELVSLAIQLVQHEAAGKEFDLWKTMSG